MIWNEIIISKNANKDLPICPYRDDWFQSECHNCDFCGRNEEAEHGRKFETVVIDDFNFFKDELKKVDEQQIIYGDKVLKR